MLACTLTLKGRETPILLPGMAVDDYSSLIEEGRIDKGIDLGHHPINQRNENGCPVTKYLNIKTVDHGTTWVNNVINRPVGGKQGIRLIESSYDPADTDIFVVVKLGQPNTGVISNKVFYDSWRLIQGRRYLRYNENTPVNKDTYAVSEIVTAVLVHQNECIAVKTAVNHRSVLMSVANANGTPMLSVCQSEPVRNMSR